MVTGRLEKFYENNVLADQSYVEDDSMTVAQYVESVAKEIGPVKLHSFYRYDKGEGLQKREDNFGEEIANMVSGNKDQQNIEIKSRYRPPCSGQRRDFYRKKASKIWIVDSEYSNIINCPAIFVHAWQI